MTRFSRIGFWDHLEKARKQIAYIHNVQVRPIDTHEILDALRGDILSAEA